MLLALDGADEAVAWCTAVRQPACSGCARNVQRHEWRGSRARDARERCAGAVIARLELLRLPEIFYVVRAFRVPKARTTFVNAYDGCMAHAHDLGFTIRRATDADLPALGRLGALLMRTHYAFDRDRFMAPGDDPEDGYAWFLRTQLRESDVAMVE